MRWIRITAVVIASALLLQTGLAADLTKDSLETVKQNVAEKKAVLVDVREKAEWETGHIEGAIFLPLSQLQQDVSPAELNGPPGLRWCWPS